jgi:DNA repair exonuclease SbcCD ATPase subunit
MRGLAVLVVAMLATGLGGCRAAMYSALESVGIQKRELLVKRVASARDAQESAKEQFASALDRFRAVVEVDETDLERMYDKLDHEYRQSQAQAERVRERIDSVEQVAEDLFSEWEGELDEYSNPALRADSKRLLEQTQRRYGALIRTMRQAERSMEPVLSVFQDQVLVLKHNLNAQAVGSLRRELSSIEEQTAVLVKQMERSIAEANEFIETLNAPPEPSG